MLYVVVGIVYVSFQYHIVFDVQQLYILPSTADKTKNMKPT